LKPYYNWQMKNLLKTGLYTFFVLMACFNSAKAYTEQMATQTARQTWWYFKQVINDPYKNQYGFSAKMLNNQWITNISINEIGEYIGMMLTDSGLTAEVKFKDSSEIVDWAFVGGKILIGAFSFRIKEKTIKVELLTEFFGAKFILENCVTLDFLERSKRREEPIGLDSSIGFLNRRYYGGSAGFYNYLSQNMAYPSFAHKIGLVGYCYVSFVVLPNGSVKDIIIEQSIGGGTAEECYRLIADISNFKPNDKDDAARFTLPIKLVL